jgi:hypothetical protein
MTECIQDRLVFSSAHGRREIVAEFSGGTISSDAGGLLLQETDSKLNLLSRFSQCFFDGRNPILIEHSVEQMVRQRVYALALGYEDLNDHDQLRQDPLWGLMAGKAEPGREPLAGKSTLSRMELGTGMPTRYKKISFWRDSVDELLVDVFLEAHPVAPEEIVLDLDTTDLALHGKQEGRFYHGHYGHYCYLPLYIFCGDHVLCARLRPSSSGPAVGSQKEVERIVQQIRLRWPEVRIILRGDSGFCADQLMTWCEQNRVGYVLRCGSRSNRAHDAPAGQRARVLVHRSLRYAPQLRWLTCAGHRDDATGRLWGAFVCLFQSAQGSRQDPVLGPRRIRGLGQAAGRRYLCDAVRR